MNERYSTFGFRIWLYIVLGTSAFVGPDMAVPNRHPLGLEGNSSTVTWSTTHQTIDGFGVADAMHMQSTGSGISAYASFLFGTSPGDIGLSILRGEVPSGLAHLGRGQGGAGEGDCTTVSNSCAGPGFVVDFQAAQAVNPNIRYWGYSGSPPPWMKTNKSVNCTDNGGNGSLLSSDYQAFATWVANWQKSWVTLYGVTPVAVSVQTEPDLCETDYPIAAWTDQQMDTFIKSNLGPTFASDGISTLILLPETAYYHDLKSIADTCMTDPSCYRYVGIIGWHDYDSSFGYPANATPNPYASKVDRYWMTEVSDNFSGKWDPTITSGMAWAALIDDRMAVENANAWFHWTTWSVSATDNLGLIRRDTREIAKRAYVIGNWSLFVRPGWVRIDATHIPQANVLVSAFKDPSGSKKFAIVVVNENSSSVSQTINFSGFTATTVTAWITNSSNSLASQPDVPAGTGFTYAVPGSSVVTFVGTAD
jgi:glucuronoarabinoxylan endo-1,4-beta-xylanase